jgi:hypothetical protein
MVKALSRIVLPSTGKPRMPEAGAGRFIADRYGDRGSGLTLLGAGEWSRARFHRPASDLAGGPAVGCRRSRSHRRLAAGAADLAGRSPGRRQGPRRTPVHGRRAARSTAHHPRRLAQPQRAGERLGHQRRHRLGNAAYDDWLYDAAWLLYWWPWYPAWRRIDIRAELDRHWKAGGGLPADLGFRLRCYQLHIGLDAMTYNAFTGRFDELARNAEQTMALI